MNIKEFTISDIDEFTKHYLVCALWASDMEDLPDDKRTDFKSIYDFDTDSIKLAYNDCQKFQKENPIPQYNDPVYSNIELAGHDFWLDRNGHGAGFRDRGLGETGKKLSNAANNFGNQECYVGDDGKVYLS